MYLGHHGDLLCVCNPVQVFLIAYPLHGKLPVMKAEAISERLGLLVLEARCTDELL
jgi:hypothetical protein